ncbi:MAG: hypothetical protein ACYSTS_19420 [Planctomycetota bacterium]|jgi:hypothetical protein
MDLGEGQVVFEGYEHEVAFMVTRNALERLYLQSLRELEELECLPQVETLRPSWKNRFFYGMRDIVLPNYEILGKISALRSFIRIYDSHFKAQLT